MEELKSQGLQMKSFSDIHKETVQKTKETLRQMITHGISFDSNRMLELKMITVGSDEEKKKIAENILFEVWQTALDRTEDKDNFQDIQEEVNKILQEIKSKNIQNISVEQRCILLQIASREPCDMLALIEYFESDLFHKTLDDICKKVGYYCDTIVAICSNVTIESLHGILNAQNLPEQQESGIRVPITVSSPAAMFQLWKLFRSEQFSNSTNAIAEKLSKHSNTSVTLKTFTDMKELNGVFDGETEQSSTDSENNDSSTQDSSQTLNTEPDSTYQGDLAGHPADQSSQYNKQMRGQMMATDVSSGHYSPENENFCRYFRLVNETGVKPLWKILENEATSLQMTVEGFMGASSAQTGINPTVETLLKQTETVLNKKSDFVLTKQFQEAEDKLMSSGSVIISGGAGEGKTYAAYEIMRRKGQRNNCIQINNPSDVHLVDPRIFDFVFIDDIFGNHEIDESKLQPWIHVFETLQRLVNAKAFYLIIATREIILKQCKRSLEKFSIFNNTMSLCSKNLSQSEKGKILSVVLKSKERQCSREIVEECVLAFSSDLGFPYMCNLFASDDNFFGEGPSFFKHNSFIDHGLFTQLNKSKQLSLLFLWMKDGTVPTALNRTVENDLILQKLSRTLKYDEAIDVIYDDVYAHCKIMDGVFVNVRPGGYQFSHNILYQSIGHYLAGIGLYEIVIEYSNLAFFMECISVTEFRYRPDRVFIRSEFYQHFVDRIISEVIDKNHYREMAMHPCLTQDILRILIETL
ncbi:uncharacterized protein LOC123543467 [Mercenaria mercenaria]|uniref:uncharacterized protein LOC123543467 n=1 Tax=Mercenaria mercenaria TaxID=6596 RepID=UPI00234F30C4|nr:uncharacterized protein LOC123543467 [Mercenaria mercenaria]